MLVNQLIQGGIRAILDANPYVFSQFELPDELSGAEELVINRIIYKYGDTPLFTPEPNVLMFYIGEWCKRRSPLWLRYYNAEFAEYDPIENYNRTEKTDDDLTHGHKIVTNDDLTHGHKVVTNDDLKHGHKVVTNDDLKNGLTVEAQISADNASAYQPDRKTINSGTDERDLDETHSGTDERDLDETHSGKDERDYDETHSGKDSRHIDSQIHGNIGVTSSQQMLEQEIALIPKLDCIDFIADDFKTEFCLYVY